MYGYIYKVTNLVNKKIYIGLHKAERFDENYWASGTLIKQAFEKYGMENFSREIIQECDTLDELNQAERYWIEYYNSTDTNIGYNIAYGGFCCPAHRLSESEKKQRSQELSERNRRNWQTTEYREKIIATLTQNGYNIAMKVSVK